MRLDLGGGRSEAELIRIVDAHEAIVDRVCAGDAVGAGNAMAYHFDLSVNLPSRDEAGRTTSTQFIS
jgi:DNA-binding FadR family transcriptional regulator